MLVLVCCGSPEEIVRAKESGIVYAVKLYPAGATTNSDSGVTDIQRIKPALQVRIRSLQRSNAHHR